MYTKSKAAIKTDYILQIPFFKNNSIGTPS